MKCVPRRASPDHNDVAMPISQIAIHDHEISCENRWLPLCPAASWQHEEMPPRKSGSATSV